MNFGNIPVKARLNASIQRSRRLHQIGFSFFKFILFCLISFIIIGTVCIYGMIRGILDSAPDISSINMKPTGYTTNIYDADNHITASLNHEDHEREEVSFSEIPTDLIQAFTITQDPNFLYHHGNDAKQSLRRIIYGFFYNTASSSFGTITQQLIRNNVFNGGFKKSLGERIEQSIQEGYLAARLEERLDKKSILELYLNSINLGSNTVGVQSAALHYFNKNVSELTLSECAVLAATAFNSSLYNPVKQQQKNAEERKKVLDELLTAQAISTEQYQEALADPVYDRLQNSSYSTTASSEPILSYYNEEVINSVLFDLQNELGYNETQAYNLVHYGGLSIYTPMDASIQSIVDEEINSLKNYPEGKFSLNYTLVVSHPDGTTNTYTELDVKTFYQSVQHISDFHNIFSNEDFMNRLIQSFRESVVHEHDTILSETINTIPQPQASMSIINQRNGYVLALSGGRGKRSDNLSINRATDSMRQPGSAFSVLSSFAPALDLCGLTLASTYYDHPLHTSNQSFTNWQETPSMGYATIRQGISFSLNTIAAQCMSEAVTPAVSYDYLSQFGFSSLTAEDKSLSLSIGSLKNGVTNLEMTAAYAAIANEGTYTKPIFYTTVVDRNGKIILEKEHNSYPVLKDTTATLLTDAMEDSISGEDYWKEYGITHTGAECKVKGMDIAGADGVSPSTGDHWFIGYSPYVTCGIWSGYDDPNPTEQSTSYYKQIWQTVMKRIHQGLSNPGFLHSGNLESAFICSKSGLLAIKGTCNHPTSNSIVYTEYFEKGTAPTQYCNRHTKVNICTDSNMQAGKFCPINQMEEHVYLIIDPKHASGLPTEDSNYALPDNLLKSICTLHHGSEPES